MTDRSIGLIFIDEIENGIHYSVQKDVWNAIGKLARDLDIQVFATTHSLEMIARQTMRLAKMNKLMNSATTACTETRLQAILKRNLQ